MLTGTVSEWQTLTPTITKRVSVQVLPSYIEELPICYYLKCLCNQFSCFSINETAEKLLYICTSYIKYTLP